jgi:hypothetical protein
VLLVCTGFEPTTSGLLLVCTGFEPTTSGLLLIGNVDMEEYDAPPAVLCDVIDVVTEFMVSIPFV